MKMNLKKMLALLATALLLCSLLPIGTVLPVVAEDAIDSNDPNIVLYEDFESIPAGGLGNGWTNGQKMTASVKEGVGTDNSKGIVCNGPHWSRVFKYFDVEPNTKYEISFDYFESTNSRGVMGVTVRHATEAVDFYGRTGLVGTNGKWEHYTGEFSSGSSTRMRILLQADEAVTNSDKTFDNIIIRKAGSAEPEQIGVLKNTDFELGSMEKWNVANGATAEIVTDDVHGGEYAVKLSGGEYEGFTQVVSVLPNTKYRVSLWAKRISGGGSHHSYIMHYTGTSNIAYVSVDGQKADGWKKYTYTFDTGDNEYVMFKIGVVDPYSTFIYDDISFGVDTDLEFDDYIYNGGFESGDLSKWENVYSDSVITDDAKTGANALHLKGGQWTAVRQGFVAQPNTDYVISFWAKRVAGSAPISVWLKNDGNLLDPDGNEIGGNYDCGAEWTKIEHNFNSYQHTYIEMLLGLPEAGNEFIIDDVKVAKAEKPYIPPMELTSFWVDTNRPATPEKNLILNGSFEDAEGGQWNIPTFMDGVLKVVEDDTAPEGNKVLFLDGSNVTEPMWHVFWVDVEPNTDYIFSSFVKGAYLSSTNSGKATFGVIDPDSEEFLIYPSLENTNSKKTLQMVPTAWDDAWHLRAVSFNTGNKSRVGVAVYDAGSQMYLDGIALYKNGDGVKYINPQNVNYITGNTNVEEFTCTVENNAVSNFDFSAGEAGWADGEGWDNEFVSLYESEYGYGNALHYVGSKKPVGTHYVRWIDVEPNTMYTFTASIRILESGDGYLALQDRCITIPHKFLQLDFDQDAFGEEWVRIAVNFQSNVYDKIGIAVVDLGGEALLDNVRVFKVGAGAEVEDPFVEAPVEPDDPDEPSDPSEPDEPSDPDEPSKPEDPGESPDTGVSTVGAVMALALVPTSALATWLTRKKRK